jgi:ribonucleoside-diphosphate reductase alpha chain
VQPFISGASKRLTYQRTTVEDIEQAYIEGHGLKLAIYRDGSAAQVLSTKDSGDVSAAANMVNRRRLRCPHFSDHKFSIEGHEGYITAGLYEDGPPGEIWLTMAKEGSTLSGMMDAFATSISLALQYGVPLRDLVNKFSHMRFEPSGRTENNEIPVAQSIVDYIFRWLSQFQRGREGRVRGVISRREGEADGAGIHLRRQANHWRADDQWAQLRHPDRCAALRELRLDHDPRGYLLQMRQLWKYHGLRIASHLKGGDQECQ